MRGRFRDTASRNTGVLCCPTFKFRASVLAGGNQLQRRYGPVIAVLLCIGSTTVPNTWHVHTCRTPYGVGLSAFQPQMQRCSAVLLVLGYSVTRQPKFAPHILSDQSRYCLFHMGAPHAKSRVIFPLSLVLC